MDRIVVAAPGKSQIEFSASKSLKQQNVLFRPYLNPHLWMGAREPAENGRQPALGKVLRYAQPYPPFNFAVTQSIDRRVIQLENPFRIAEQTFSRRSQR